MYYDKLYDPYELLPLSTGLGCLESFGLWSKVQLPVINAIADASTSRLSLGFGVSLLDNWDIQLISQTPSWFTRATKDVTSIEQRPESIEFQLPHYYNQCRPRGDKGGCTDDTALGRLKCEHPNCSKTFGTTTHRRRHSER